MYPRTVKKVKHFPFPSRDVHYHKLSLAGNKSAKLFLQCIKHKRHWTDQGKWRVWAGRRQGRAARCWRWRPGEPDPRQPAASSWGQRRHRAMTTFGGLRMMLWKQWRHLADWGWCYESNDDIWRTEDDVMKAWRHLAEWGWCYESNDDIWRTEDDVKKAMKTFGGLMMMYVRQWERHLSDWWWVHLGKDEVIKVSISLMLRYLSIAHDGTHRIHDFIKALMVFGRLVWRLVMYLHGLTSLRSSLFLNKNDFGT